METSTQPIEGNGAQAGEVLLRQMTLSRARELAKSSDYEAALVLLLQMEPTAAALDLRARIEVQRGRYDDACALWKEVLEEAPDHAGAKKGLRDVERAATLRRVLRGFAAGAVVLAAGGLAFATLRSSDEGPVEATMQPAPEPQPLQAAQPVATRPQPIAAAKRSITAQAPAATVVSAQAAPQPSAAAHAPAGLPQVALPEGVSRRLDDGVQVYSFDAGLFVEGVAFVPGGREQITALGRALAPYGDSIQIELVGYVDTLPVPVEKQFHGNTELALSRANAVLGRIARTTRIPADAVGLRAVGSRLGPASDEQGDPRNRTVEIRVSPRGEL